MRLVDTSDLWWKNAVIYCVDVEKYLDDDGDGRGDLQGLARRIDYLVELGVSCLWLMPISTTPNRDDGYDISDFYGIDPRLGTHGDLVELIRTAEDRGIRVIVDLVVNHTSDKHPWFVSARKSRDSPFRDFYVWRDEIPADAPQNVFPDVEDSVWEWDEKTEQYYEHNFYRHQPDLNMDNPDVREELSKVLGYWLQLGVSGFRIDAVPFIAGPEERSHNLLRSLREFAQRRSRDGMLLGEVNLPHQQQLDYFGKDGDGELHMQFDFISNQALYLALARKDPAPLIRALEGRPALDSVSQWANFVRNHDELSLDKLTDAEREEVFAAFAPEESQRLYGRGIRRRLPTMLGDPRRVRMVYSLLFSLPGTPVLFYGEEIGMGDNPEVEGRLAVRTPMQWTKDGGFSSAKANRYPQPMPAGAYGPQHVNVEQQLSDPDSLLKFVTHLAQTYRRSPEIGWGELQIHETGAPGVLAHSVTSSVGRMVALHNFSDEAAMTEVAIDGEPEGTTFIDLRDGTEAPFTGGVLSLDLPGYGARRLRASRPGDGRLR